MEVTPLFQQFKQVHKGAENEAVILRERIWILLKLQERTIQAGLIAHSQRTSGGLLRIRVSYQVGNILTKCAATASEEEL
jgi:hypothetical protein